MMITIHGLNRNTKYSDIKKVIKDECKIDNFILDNLVNSEIGNCKKIRVGLANDLEGNTLVRKLDGFRLHGSTLRVVRVGQPLPGQQDDKYNDNSHQPGFQQSGPWNQSGPWQPTFQRQADGPGFTSQNNNVNINQHSIPNFGPNDQYSGQRFAPGHTSRNDIYTQQKYTGNNLDPHSTRAPLLRDVQLMNVPLAMHRQPFITQQDKMTTISTDTFQGPVGVHNSPHYGKGPGPGHVSPWTQPQGDTFESRPYRDGSTHNPTGGILRVPEGFPNKPFNRLTGSDIKNYPDNPGRKDFGSRIDRSDDSKFSSGFRSDRPDDFVRKDDNRLDFVKKGVPSGSRDEYYARKDEPIGGRDDFSKKDLPLNRRDEPFGRKDGPLGRRDEPFVRKDGPLGRRDESFGRKDGPVDRRDEPFVRKDGPVGRRDEPFVRKDGPVGRRDEPFVRKDGPVGRRDEPFGRKDVPMDRRDEPFVRKDIPVGRRDESFVRKDEPVGRRDEPFGRKDVPMDRRDEPFVRKDGPVGRRDEPFVRKDDPIGRRDEPFGRKDGPIVRREEPFGRKDTLLVSRDESFSRRDDPNGRRNDFTRKDEPISRDDISRKDDQFRRNEPFGRKGDMGRGDYDRKGDLGRGDDFDRHDFTRKDIIIRDFDNENRIDKTRGDNNFQKRSDFTRESVNEKSNFGGIVMRKDLFGPSGKRDDNFDRNNDVDRRISPRRGTTGRRSPVRAVSPGKYKTQSRRSPNRYSPSQSFDIKPSYQDLPQSKQVRPAYEPVTSAPNYSGGYQRNAYENEPAPGRSTDHPRSWQGRDSDIHRRKPEKDDRVFGGPSFEAKIRRSRSRSIPRERSPLRQSKGHSSSRSPHRSWATEKRRDIEDAPPPPAWPGQEPRRYEKDNHRPRDPPTYREETSRHDLKRREEPDTSDVWKVKRPRIEEEFDIPPRGELKMKPYVRDRSDDRRADRFYPDRSENFRKPDIYTSEEQNYRRDDFRRENTRRESPRRQPDKQRPSEHYSRPQHVREQHDKAVSKIADKLCSKHKVTDSRVHDELKMTLLLKINTAFGNRDVGAGDILEWFFRRYNEVEQDEMFEDVANGIPNVAVSKRSDDAMKPTIASKSESLQAKKEKVKEHYKKTIDTIRTRILKEHGFRPTSDNFRPIAEELTMALLKLLLKIGEEYGILSPNLLLEKYTESYSKLYEDTMFQDIVKRVRQRQKDFPAESGESSSKVVQMSPDVIRTDESAMVPTEHKSNWDVPPKDMQPVPMAAYQQFGVPVYPVPYAPEYMAQFQPDLGQFHDPNEMRYTLFLCKDDFDIINSNETCLLKDFLVSEIFASSTSDWSPEFSLKGLQSVHRYEVTTNDDRSKDWLINLNFSKFTPFGVLVYTKEELWYERAAIWLPGHSKFKSVEPLVKLQLQNKHVEGLNIEKWKLVKKIINANGTRIYVDMPPSSARYLENIQMKLSYELQKVSVYLKAMAVDKDTFDSGLKEFDLTDPTLLATAMQKATIPVVPDTPGLVKICLKGNKTINVEQAKKIKEILIYKIFKYHMEPHSKCRTDFEKHGFCRPGYFVVQPENDDSRKWITCLVDIGKLNRHEIIVLNDRSPLKYLRFYVTVCHYGAMNASAALEKLKTSNKGLGLNFHHWKIISVKGHLSQYSKLNIDIDLESAEKLKEYRYQLDYGKSVVKFKHTYKDIDKQIQKFKSETQDKYDVANMDIASEDESDDDVIELD